MSKIIFPSSPTIGDEYTSGGVTWKWNGNAWDVLGSDNVDAINIKVNTPVTLDYTAPKVGDTLQDITNKVAGLQDSTNNETTHKSSAISHGSGSVEDRLDNITDGVITKDANDDILSMMTFGETTVFNRDVNGDIESWENDTHVWTLTKTNGEIIGWTLTEKP